MRTSWLTRQSRLAASIAAILISGASAASAQTTSFTYQGKLTDAGSAATGSFDFQFRLFDAASGGSQTGPTLALEDVVVADGVFSVVLDFGSAPFPGASRFLEIAVRAGATTGGYTHLAPLHALTSAPYSIRSQSAGTADTATSANSLSASCNGCVTTSALLDNNVTNAKILSLAGSKITGTVPVAAVPAGSANYLQNGTTQQSASFNINGNGTAAGTLNAGEFTYIKAQTAYYAVSDAAFTGRDGVPVGNTTGLGGAYPTAATVWGLAAPVNLPHGATITNVRFIYVDNSTSALTLSLFSHSMVGGFFNTIATHTTTVNTSAVQNVNVTASSTVDNNGTSLGILAFPVGGWSDFSMMVRGAVITYTMPGPAR